MKRTRSVLASAIGIFTLVLLVGVSAPASAAPPVSSINLSCNKLAAATNPAASFSVPIAQRYSAAVEERTFDQIPDADIIQMAGGLDCDYSNGLLAGQRDDSGAVGVNVQYLPYQAAGYWRWASSGLAPVTTPDSFFCFGITTSECQLETSVGGDWLSVEVQGATSDAIAEDLSYRISTALQLGQKTPYVPPIYATTLPHGCTTLIRPSVWRAAVGSPVPLVPFPAPPGWSPMNQAELVNRSVFCDMDDAMGSASAGSVQTLPGGRWAFLALRSTLTTPGALTPISVPGMRTGDTAYTRCAPRQARCVLDALIATHWVEVDLWTAARGGTLITTNRLAAMRPLLTEIVHQIYTP
jgi:hypothetical protein